MAPHQGRWGRAQPRDRLAVAELNVDALRQVEAVLGELALNVTPTAETVSADDH
jgi:hypothetical protein